MSPGNKLSCSSSGGINNLHESVITHILSRLPTNEAIRTSILSRDWRYNWTNSMYSVDIDDSRRGYYKRCNNMVYLLNKLLISRNLTRLRLMFYNYDDSVRMQTWISDALGCNLEVLEVMFRGGIIFPCSLLCSTSLRKLELRFYHECILNVVPRNCAPNLTSLCLFKVRIVNMNPNTNTSSISFSFPVLETFGLDCCKWLNVNLVEINAPLLTTFISESPTCEYCSIMIFAPRLVKFECSYALPGNSILDRPSSIIQSSIIAAVLRTDGYRWLSNNDGLQTPCLLNRFTGLKELELSHFTVQVSQLSTPLPCLNKLRRLALTKCTAKKLFELLHLTPLLKVLSINVVWLGKYDYGTMEHVPSCIESQLEEVEFRNFKCHALQYMLAKFLLQKGERLKRISIVRYASFDRPEEVRSTLLAFPRSSPCLNIDFHRR